MVLTLSDASPEMLLATLPQLLLQLLTSLTVKRDSKTTSVPLEGVEAHRSRYKDEDFSFILKCRMRERRGASTALSGSSATV
jgi:hypothetical protein